jgi:hypothetical protein
MSYIISIKRIDQDLKSKLKFTQKPRKLCFKILDQINLSFEQNFMLKLRPRLRLGLILILNILFTPRKRQREILQSQK